MGDKRYIVKRYLKDDLDGIHFAVCGLTQEKLAVYAGISDIELSELIKQKEIVDGEFKYVISEV